MTDGVLETSTTLTFTKCEKESGQAPSKLRMTADTIASFKENIDKGKMPAATEKFNKEYHEIRQALIAAETAAAEQQVMATVMNGGKSPEDIEKEKALEFARLKEEQQIARLASVHVVKPKLDKLVLEPTAPEMIFGKNEKGFVAKINAPTLTPRALMVPMYFAKTYKKIGKNSSLYKLADSIIEQQEIQMVVNPEDPTMMMRMAIEAPPPPPKVANWRGLFDNSPFKSQNSNRELHIKNESEKEDVVPIAMEQKGITKEELSDRKMKAQIGEELTEIRRLRKGLAGTTPFNDGLLERESSLLKMLSEISGIEIEKKEFSQDLEPEVTDFQRFIDEIIGYRKPLTAEEYDEKERELEEHYTDPEVVEKMHALQLKNILYDLNTPESYERISEAERKDNEIKASRTSALELLEQTEQTLLVNIANVDNDIKTETAPAPQQQKNTANIKAAAEEQAKMLHSRNQRADLVNGAEEQAKMLHFRNQRADLVNGAEEQAKMLHFRNQRADLVNGAEEQAKMLHSRNQRADLVNGAEEQAKMLHSRNQRAELVNGAEEQAKMLHFRNQRADLVNGAEEQAKMLHIRNKREELINSAVEQAKLLFEKEKIEENRINETNSLKLGAEEQAQMLHSRNQRADLVNGAEEQAQMLHSRNKRADLVNGAEEQAQMLHSRNQRADLVNGAEEQAQMLHSRNQRADLVNGAEEQAQMLHFRNQRADLVNGAEEQAKMILEFNRQQEFLEQQEKLKKQQEEQLRIQREQQRALDIQKELAHLRIAAAEQARVIHEKNQKADIMNGAEEQARILFEKAKKEMMQQTSAPQVVVDVPQVTATQQQVVAIEQPKNPTLQILNLELTDVNYRYGSIVSPSKPIKVNQTQISKMRKARKIEKNENTTDVKDMLVSLKEQLEELGLGSEQEKTYNDSFSLAA